MTRGICASCWVQSVLLRRLFVHLAQLIHPIGPVDRTAFETLLEVAEHVAPGPVEIRIRFVPFAALTPADVRERQTRLLVAHTLGTQHDERGGGWLFALCRGE